LKEKKIELWSKKNLYKKAYLRGKYSTKRRDDRAFLKGGSSF